MMAVPEPPIVWVGCAPHNYTVGKNRTVALEAIVIHTTAGGSSIEALDNWFNSNNYDAQGNLIRGSTNFGVGPDGRIHQYVALTDTPFANGQRPGYTSCELCDENALINANLWTISIEHVDGGKPGNHTLAQLEASAQLSAWLFQEYLFTSKATPTPVVSRRHVLGHYQFDGRDRPFCPSWLEDRYTNYLARIGQILTAPEPIPPTPPVEDYLDEWIAELRGIIAAANDDATRAAVRRADAEAKLRGLGVAP